MKNHELTSKCVYTINWCVYSLSRTDHSVSDAGKKELKLLHSASLFSPDFHVFFALVLSSYVSFPLSAHSSYCRLDLSLFHLTDSALLIHCLARKKLGELCKWVLSSKALWKLPKQTVVWISNTKKNCILFWKTLQRMLTALWFCHRQTEQKEIVIIFYSCFLFISHYDSVLKMTLVWAHLLNSIHTYIPSFLSRTETDKIFKKKKEITPK